MASSTPISINATTQLPLKLIPSNFPSWRAQFDALVYGFDLAGYIEGSMVPPEKEIEQGGKQVANHAYNLWLRMKNIVDDLNLAGVAMDDDDLISSILNGVGPKFREISTAIKARESSISFEELHDKLTFFELHLKQENISDVSILTTNHVKKSHNSNGKSFPPKKQNRHFSSHDRRPSSVTYQLCDKPEHSAKKCYEGRNACSEDVDPHPHNHRKWVASEEHS
ncbi:hypothetical protein CCACVL1_30747 [Corchorus capsularis]|uniref:Retrotransposon Copia-like N-terminal domain-containing protein n=1 Tax=Corchorus capsularis TaxID=210143 RepID=A0A1R3FVX0_COCAP|nr:hypothetical protein CCACVL1_30747 [Corchorus capsularis]